VLEAFEPGTGVVCPSCEREFHPDAMICVPCGIHLDSGRPVLTSTTTDEESLNMHAEAWLWFVSWILWIMPMPVPLKSEAYGSKKPWAIRGIAVLTILASIAFLIATHGTRSPFAEPGKNLKLWPPGKVFTAQSMREDPVEYWSDQRVQDEIDDLDEDDLKEFDEIKAKLRGQVPDKELDRRALKEWDRKQRALIDEPPEIYPNDTPAQFAWYQLFTHALLHDNSSVLGCALHLGGNMLFLLVFGTRVNALIGNVATLIVYPILAVGAAAAQLLFGHPHEPMLGASGAIMGLAGMYLVLFPVPRVYCGMWFRMFFFFFGLWIFAVRGFWVLLIYFAWDALMLALNSSDGTAHWAHVGGFVLGVAIALGLLFSRLVYCGGADLLSVSLGRRAWPLIGRPARWSERLTRLA
jgi:membrane associated rhomboid family serine protease